MTRPHIKELERLCQKPDHRRLGNWMARRITRPAALRITWLLLPTGLSAHAMTLAAWCVGLAGAAAFGYGSNASWLVGAMLLQLWYLLDHVDGQLARYRGTASLDGVQLDYLMHHSIALAVPCGVGLGLEAMTGKRLFILAGIVWGMGVLVVTLANDTRYKAFVQRLKRVHGPLEVLGGGAARPQPAAALPRKLVPLAGWCLRKACEIHVTMNLLGLLALASLVAPSTAHMAAKLYLIGIAAAAALLALVTIRRLVAGQAAEAEFAAWYRPAEGQELVFRDGWWFVEPAEASSSGASNAGAAPPAARSY